jgi:hypothetical protein
VRTGSTVETNWSVVNAVRSAQTTVLAANVITPAKTNSDTTAKVRSMQVPPGIQDEVRPGSH